MRHRSPPTPRQGTPLRAASGVNEIGEHQRVFKQLANIACHSCSLPLQRRIADFCSERSGRASVDALIEHYSIEVPLYTVTAVTRHVAKEAYKFNLERPSGVEPAKVQITEVDGSMLPIVEYKEAGEVTDPAEKSDKRKRRICQWNEIRVCSTHNPKLVDARYGVCFGGVLETGLLMMAMTCAQSGMDLSTHIHGVGETERRGSPRSMRSSLAAKEATCSISTICANTWARRQQAAQERTQVRGERDGWRNRKRGSKKTNTRK